MIGTPSAHRTTYLIFQLQKLVIRMARAAGIAHGCGLTAALQPVGHPGLGPNALYDMNLWDTSGTAGLDNFPVCELLTSDKPSRYRFRQAIAPTRKSSSNAPLVAKTILVATDAGRFLICTFLLAHGRPSFLLVRKGMHAIVPVFAAEQRLWDGRHAHCNFTRCVLSLPIYSGIVDSSGAQ